MTDERGHEARHSERGLWLFDDAPIMGGAERFGLRLGCHVLARRPELAPRVVCPPGTELASAAARAGLEHVPAAFPPIGPLGAARWPGAVLAVRRLLKSAGERTVIVGNTARAQAYLAAAGLLGGGPRPVYVVHEQDTLARPSGRLAYRRGASIVAIGDNVAAVCRERLPGVRIWKANNFLAAEALAGPSRDPGPVGAPRTLGVLSRLIPEKGVLELVEDLAGGGRWSRLTVAGERQDPAYAELIEMRAGELGLGERVSLVGHLEDVGAFFDSIDALVVPSVGNEGQPTVILEALAAGLPCLVRRQVYSPDFLGLPVFPYEGPDQLAEGLAGLPGAAVDRDLLAARFGPEQALEAILDAATARR